MLIHHDLNPETNFTLSNTVCGGLTLYCCLLCRVWKGDQCMATLQGHRGRGVWRTAMLPHQQLATAGADGSIKLWSLAEHLPAACLEGTAEANERCGDRAQQGISPASAVPGPQMEMLTLQHTTAPLASAGEQNSLHATFLLCSELRPGLSWQLSK